MRARTRFVMLPAIQFDGQANRRRIEIEDATTRDVLTMKTNAVDLTQPQVLSEFAFGWRLVAAQLARASFHGFVIHHDLDSFRAVQAARSNLPHPSSPLSQSRVRGSKVFPLLNISKSHPPQSPFLRKGEAAPIAPRFFLPPSCGRGKTSTMLRALSPPSERRGSTRSVGGMSGAA